jgi:hypothetical protein
MDPLNLDLTDQLCQAKKKLKEGAQGDQTAAGILEILYDCRFIIRFDVAKMPFEIGLSLSVGRSQILVQPRTRWYWPQVVWRRPGCTDLLAIIADENFGEAPEMPPKSDWISMEWVRTIDAT